LASMGIYIFTWEKLRYYLTEDEKNPDSSNDFGKNIIPAMLNAGEKLYAYEFEGYWKDVGTIDSLWEANMDLLGSHPTLDLKGREWRILSRNNALPPHYVGQGAVVNNSIITEGCEIYGTVINSVLSEGVVVERGAVVRDSVILGNVVLKADATVDYSVIDSDTVVGVGATVGKEKSEAQGITLVGGNLEIPDGVVVPDGVRCGKEMLAELSAN